MMRDMAQSGNELDCCPENRLVIRTEACQFAIDYGGARTALIEAVETLESLNQCPFKNFHWKPFELTSMMSPEILQLLAMV